MTNAAERATDLLIHRITEGLDPERERELNELLAQCPEIDAESFELAAAAIELTVTETSEPLPSTLRTRVSAQALEYYAPGRSHSTQPAAQGAKDDAGGQVVPFRPSQAQPEQRPNPMSWLGWIAAAATLVFALTFWPRAEAPVNIVESPPVVVPTEQTATEARDVLIAEATDLVQLSWTATEDPAAAGAGGEVVWSTDQQKGFMSFSGLPVNDPAVEQYQLWIFDTEQDARYPVDGGIFDIAASGETVIEIDAKLAITEPTLFAITIEKPGGVVVSSRERLPLLAQVG